MSEELNLDVVMSRRFELVDEIGVIAGKHKAELAPFSEELSLCETFIKDHMNKAGLQQAKTDAGMAFFTTKDSVTVKDMEAAIKYMVDQTPMPEIPGIEDAAQWQAVLDWITLKGMWGLLNKAVNKTAVKELLTATPPIAPATLGVEYGSYKDLGWRRGK